MSKTDDAPQFVMDLDNLRPLEQMVLDLRGEGHSAATLVGAAEKRGINIKEHPAYHLVTFYKTFSCIHKTHDTPTKEQACVESLIVKAVIQCLRTQLEALLRKKMLRDEWGKRYVYWSCADTEPCRARIGTIESTSSLTITVLHPECSCTMRYCSPDDETDEELYNAFEALADSDPRLVPVFVQNVEASGWAIAPPTAEGDDEWECDDSDDVMDPSRYDLSFWEPDCGALHDTGPQRSRQHRAASVEVQQLDDAGAMINGYTVTPRYCECPDFQERLLPCKHLYRLAHELGLRPLPMLKTNVANKPVADKAARAHRHTSMWLAIILGSFGGHLFHQKKPIWGILFAAFWWTGVPCFVSLISAVLYAGTPDSKWRDTCMPGGSCYGRLLSSENAQKWALQPRYLHVFTTVVFWIIVVIGFIIGLAKLS